MGCFPKKKKEKVRKMQVVEGSKPPATLIRVNMSKTLMKKEKKEKRLAENPLAVVTKIPEIMVAQNVKSNTLIREENPVPKELEEVLNKVPGKKDNKDLDHKRSKNPMFEGSTDSDEEGVAPGIADVDSLSFFHTKQRKKSNTRNIKSSGDIDDKPPSPSLPAKDDPDAKFSTNPMFAASNDLPPSPSEVVKDSDIAFSIATGFRPESLIIVGEDIPPPPPGDTVKRSKSLKTNSKKKKSVKKIPEDEDMPPPPPADTVKRSKSMKTNSKKKKSMKQIPGTPHPKAPENSITAEKPTELSGEKVIKAPTLPPRKSKINSSKPSKTDSGSKHTELSSKEPLVISNEDTKNSPTKKNAEEKPKEKKQEIKKPKEKKQEIKKPKEKKQEIKKPKEKKQEIKKPKEKNQEIKKPKEKKQEIKNPKEKKQEIKNPKEKSQESKNPKEKKQEIKKAIEKKLKINSKPPGKKSEAAKTKSVKKDSASTPSALRPSDPRWDPYKKMEKIGLPEGAVTHKILADGLNPEEYFLSAPITAGFCLKLKMDLNENVSLLVGDGTAITKAKGKAGSAGGVTAKDSKLKRKNGSKAVKPAVFELKGSKWFIEHQTSGIHTIEAEKINIKQTVYVYGCNNATIMIKGKCNSILVDNCEKVDVVFESVLASCEVVNCTNIKAQINQQASTVTIDKTIGAVIYVMKKETTKTLQIIASKSTGLNVSFPGENGTDFIEKPIPEQFTYKIEKNGTVSSNVSDLYGP